MYDQPAEDIATLFIRLRKGDTSLQEEVPQRFDRWFLTIAMHRLGQKNHRIAYESACKEFSSSVKTITRKKDLVPQAYSIIKNNIQKSSEQFRAGDFSNMMLQQRPPSELLHLVWDKLNANEQALFSLFYVQRNRDRLEAHPQSVEQLALQVLNIRQKIKRLMKDDASITFTNTQSQSNHDLLPLPLFEAGILANQQEKEAFETWLLNVPEVCNDLMEFVPFVQALQDPKVSQAFFKEVDDGKSEVEVPQQTTKSVTSTPIPSETNTPVEKPVEKSIEAPEPEKDVKIKTNEPDFPISEEIENYANQNSSNDTLKTILIAVVMAVILIALLSFLSSN
ncbi:MAG: hypothetical protein ACON4U_01125 [Myxococcota bacterium]